MAETKAVPVCFWMFFSQGFLSISSFSAQTAHILRIKPREPTCVLHVSFTYPSFCFHAIFAGAAWWFRNGLRNQYTTGGLFDSNEWNQSELKVELKWNHFWFICHIMNKFEDSGIKNPKISHVEVDLSLSSTALSLPWHSSPGAVAQFSRCRRKVLPQQ